MNEVGLLIWVALLVVGVGGSIVSTIRKAASQPPASPSPPAAVPQREETVRQLVAALQAQARGEMVAQPSRQAVPRPVAPAAAAPRPAAPALPRRAQQAPPATEAFPWPVERRASRLRLFGARGDAVKGMIAAEVLGSPRALRDEPFWR